MAAGAEEVCSGRSGAFPPGCIRLLSGGTREGLGGLPFPGVTAASVALLGWAGEVAGSGADSHSYSTGGKKTTQPCHSWKPKAFLTACISYSSKFWLWRGHPRRVNPPDLTLADPPSRAATAPLPSPCPLRRALPSPSPSWGKLWSFPQTITPVHHPQTHGARAGLSPAQPSASSSPALPKNQGASLINTPN